MTPFPTSSPKPQQTSSTQVPIEFSSAPSQVQTHIYRQALSSTAQALHVNVSDLMLLLSEGASFKDMVDESGLSAAELTQTVTDGLQGHGLGKMNSGSYAAAMLSRLGL